MLEIPPRSGTDPEASQINGDTKIPAHQQTSSNLVDSVRHAAVVAGTPDEQPAPANIANQLPSSPILRFVQEDGPWSPETPRTAGHQSGIGQVVNNCNRLL